MRKIILQPVGSKAAQERYEKNVSNGIDINGISEYIDERYFKEISEGVLNNKVQAWAVSNGIDGRNYNKFQRMNIDDLVFFIKSKEIFAWARITSKMKNRKLAIRLFEYDNDDETWENIFFVTKPQEIKLSMEEFNHLADYNKKFIAQGMFVLDEEKSKNILNKMGIEIRVSDNDSKLKISKPNKMNSFIPRIFISYAHADEYYKNELKKHLRAIEDTFSAQIWDDRKLDMGTNYEEKIEEEINEANIIILLISADFFDSFYCRTIELPRAVEKCGDDSFRLIPIIVRDCVWDKMGGMPPNITTYPQNGSNIFASLDKDATYASITREIISLIEKVKNSIEKDN